MGRDRPGHPVKIRDGTQDGTITIFLSKSGMGHGTGQSLFFFCFKTYFSCFRTSFSCFRMSFSCFLSFFLESDFVLGLDVLGQRSLSRDFFSCYCPGTKGHRDKNSFCPGTKGQRDVPSLGNTTYNIIFFWWKTVSCLVLWTTVLKV